MNKFIFILMLSFAMLTAAYSLSVPFSAYALKKNESVNVSYSFGNHLQILCYEGGLQTVGSMTWPYQGNLYSSSLPGLLKTKKDISGSFADSSGTITITNTTNNKFYIYCDFGF